MITLYDGDVLKSNADYICHQVNCKGIMGGGLALQIKQIYPEAYKHYVGYCERKLFSRELLGDYFVTPVIGRNKKKSIIVHLFGQFDCGCGNLQTSYQALETAWKGFLLYLCKNDKNRTEPIKIAIPYKIGCGLAGGDWNIVYKIFEKYDCDKFDVQIWKFS